MVFTLETWLPWQQGRVYTYQLDFKILPIHVEEESRNFKKKSLSFPEIFVENHQGRQKTPPPPQSLALQG